LAIALSHHTHLLPSSCLAFGKSAWMLALSWDHPTPRTMANACLPMGGCYPTACLPLLGVMALLAFSIDAGRKTGERRPQIHHCHSPSKPRHPLNLWHYPGNGISMSRPTQLKLLAVGKQGPWGQGYKRDLKVRASCSQGLTAPSLDLSSLSLATQVL